MAWPGLREFDLSDDRLRRSLYGIVLTQGRRNDMARFVNARLLRADWLASGIGDQVGITGFDACRPLFGLPGR